MADVWLTFSISQNSQSIPNNTSNVTVTVYANWRYGYYNKNNKSGTVTINGISYSFAAPFNTGVSSSGSCIICTKTVNVEHNSNGTKTLSVSASYTTGVVGTVSASTTKALTTIPRVSDLSVDVETVLADGTSQVIATATKKADAFTDVLTVSLGDYSQEVTSGTAFTIPVEWNNAISGTSAVATVEVETFNGAASIGTNTISLTVTVPESVVPVINDVVLTEAVAVVTEAFGALYVQNLSQLNVSIDASGVYGSVIKSYSTTLDGVNYIQQAFTSNVIKTAGTLEIAVKITDSRGRIAEETVTVNIVEYAKPTITSMTYIHCDAGGNQDSNGTYTKITIGYKVYPVSSKNTKSIVVKYKTTSAETYTSRTLTLSDWEGTVETIISGTDPTVTYEYVAELTDKINADSPETFRITTGIVVLSRFAGGGGITLFGEATEEGFIVKGGKPTTLNDLTVLGNTILNNPLGIPYGGHGGTTAEEGLLNLGGVSITLLWENASPSSSFAAQTINIDISKYDFIGMICNYAANFPKRLMPMAMCPNIIDYQATATTPDVIRTIQIVSSSSVSIGGASNGVQTNLIPQYIYGINGMQYVL